MSTDLSPLVLRFLGLYSRFCFLQNKDDFGVNTYTVKSVENAINCIFFIENMCIFQFKLYFHSSLTLLFNFRNNEDARWLITMWRLHRDHQISAQGIYLHKSQNPRIT